MRQIKFRAWDKDHKYMTYSIENSLNFHGQIRLNDGLFHDVEDTCYVLMQYIGSKDKNGKEIYEGDIVKHDNTHERDYLITYIQYAESDCISCVGFYSTTKDKGMCKHTHAEHIEVIGNIYQNPELLEANNEQ